MQITNPDYRLPKLSARRFIKTLPGGANQPIILGCRDLQNDEMVTCVVKLRGAERMSIEACARELLGAFIAKEWGIKVVEPVLVDVSAAFVNLELGKPHHDILSRSIGLNYGSVYLDGYTTIPVWQPLTKKEAVQAQQIVLFDLLIQNSDRRVEKPNVMSNGKDLVVYDHELAFSFIFDLPFLRNPNPSQLRTIDKSWISNLFLIAKVRGATLPDKECDDCLARLNNFFWGRVTNIVPAEWQTQQLIEIQSYLSAIILERSNFIQSVKTFL